MTYTVVILESAQKQLAKITQPHRDRLYAAIRSLKENPRPAGCRKLTNRSGWRLRVGVYRVIYEIEDDRLIVTVVAVGHRGQIYK